MPSVPDYIVHAYYKCYVFVDIDKLPNNTSRDDIIEIINKLGVPCYSGSCSEVYKEKAFEHTSFKPKVALKNAKALGKNSLMFLVHPTITNSEMVDVCLALATALDAIDSKK